MHSIKYPCPCCGYLTFESPLDGTELVCPICGWQDVKYIWDKSGLNRGLSLREAQRNFVRIGACQKIWLDAVRSPKKDENRAKDWKSLDENFEEFQRKVIERINQAFKEVQLEDGITLIEARLIDDYEFDESRKKADKTERIRQQKAHNSIVEKGLLSDSEIYIGDGESSDWHKISDVLIERLYDVLNFLDEKGYKFYLPAYMLWTIKNHEQSDSCSSEYTIYSLMPSLFNQSRYQVFTQEQNQAICQFLCLMAIYSDYADEAIAALAHWKVHCKALGNEVYYRCYH